MRRFTIIYPPTIDYEFMQQRPQRLMEQFARAGHQVYYVNLNNRHVPPREVEPNLTVVYRHHDVFTLPRRYPTVLWVSWAKTHDWIDYLRPDIAVYDCLDDFAEWRPYEDIVVGKVDLITTTARVLYDKMIQRHRNVIMVRNACEYEHFVKVDSPDLTDPVDWPFNDDQPIVGYVGALGHWVDSGLIAKVAERYRVVLIGPYFGMRRIRHHNVYELGLKNYATLPAYLKKIRVLIIPFVLNDITRATNPIKMYEYLATGRPVVTTALPEAAVYPEILVGHGHNEFLRLVSDAVRGVYDSREAIEARRKIAFVNSWHQRYETIYKRLCEIALVKMGDKALS